MVRAVLDQRLGDRVIRVHPAHRIFVTCRPIWCRGTGCANRVRPYSWEPQVSS